MITTDTIEQRSLTDFTEKAYLNYAMYVILDRALPHLADGLKPVQRRIIYAMSELGLKAHAKYKKSARTVGDVLGKFHPHGDVACYEAMVLMAQPFSYRYPFVDGQGNWGSADDPKSFAAMRYTEAKLSLYADLLLSELEQGTVAWVDNFDGTLQEPALLPARLPNVLLNGATGIAVGMSADILPHNLTEVANACIHLLQQPEANLASICYFIKAPDFPTRAEIITPGHHIEKMYETGLGSIKMRAIYTLEHHQIVVTELPYQVSGAKIIEQIALQMQQKKLPMIEDIRDESDHEHPTRIVIIPKSNRVDCEQVMLHLFATTDLERNYRVNFNMIGLDGKPCVKNLLTILTEWLSFRLITVKKRLQYRLDKILERIHLLEGFILVFLSLDDVIAVIREEDKPRDCLMTRFKLTTIQADAILDLKLRQLAKFEELKLRKELESFTQERNRLQLILSSDKRLRNLVKKEIEHDRDTFGDCRRSPLIARREAQALKEEDTLINEPITVILSLKGWLRAAKGHDVDGRELSYKVNDSFKTQINARSNQPIIFFTNDGKVYNLPGHTLASARGQGEPLTSRLTAQDNMTFDIITCGEPQEWLLLTNDAGYGFIIQISQLYVKSRNGKSCFNLPEKSLILMPCLVEDTASQWIACATNTGRLLIFSASEVPVLAKGKGNRLINISAEKARLREEWMIDIQVLKPTDTLIVVAGKRHLTLKAQDLQDYKSDRGHRGHCLPRGLQQVTKLQVNTK